MKKYVLEIENISKIYIYTNIEKIASKLLNIENVAKTIPCDVKYLKDTNIINEERNYIYIVDHNDNFININKEKNTALILTPKDKFFFPDLIYLAIGMFANDLQKQSLYFVQSSVVKYDDKHSIMLLGDPNSGKTSMAYSLMKEYGYSLVSNDNVLIDANMTICGTKNVQMRYGAIKLYFPEILPFVNRLPINLEKDEWDTKIFIDDYLKQNGYKTSDNSIITDIYNISTYENGNTFIRERDKIDKVLMIYEHITKQIRSNRYLLVSMGYPIPSFENENYMLNRYDIAKRIADTTNVYDAKGTIKSLTRKIGDKYRR